MRLLWRIYISFFASTLLALSVMAWYANSSLRRFYQDQIASELLKRANILASELEDRSLNS